MRHLERRTFPLARRMKSLSSRGFYEKALALASRIAYNTATTPLIYTSRKERRKKHTAKATKQNKREEEYGYLLQTCEEKSYASGWLDHRRTFTVPFSRRTYVCIHKYLDHASRVRVVRYTQNGFMTRAGKRGCAWQAAQKAFARGANGE